MEQIQKYPLVKGLFESQDAKTVLVNLFSSKINFHGLAAFGIEERTGEKSPMHNKRAAELKKSLNKILKVIDSAEKKGLLLKITCDVNIKLQPKNKLNIATTIEK